MKVLVTGATVYIGSRLVPRLLEQGHDVRSMVREWEFLSLDRWPDEVMVHRMAERLKHIDRSV